MAVVRRTAWPEDSSIHKVDCQRSVCSNTPSKGESEGTGNILLQMELSGPHGEKHPGT